MSAATLDMIWEQGEDLVISMIYEEGVDEVSTSPVDLTGYSVRMDIKNDVGVRLYTFNSLSIVDVDPLTTGNQPDTVTEAVLGNDGTINISVSRILTLPPNGPFYQQLSASPPKTVFNYDIFLRNTVGLQTKILKGQVTLETSVTLWL